jgi:hypothetical protein
MAGAMCNVHCGNATQQGHRDVKGELSNHRGRDEAIRLLGLG